MKKLLGGVAALGVVSVASVALAAQYHVTIVNDIHQDIVSIQIAEAGASDVPWSENLLDGVVEEGESVTDSFNTGDIDSCHLDVRIVDDDGDDYTVSNVNWCRIELMTFRRRGDDVYVETR